MRTRAAAAGLLAIAALGVSACGDSSNAKDPLAEFASTPEPTSTAPTATTTASAAPGPSIRKLVISKDLTKKPAIPRPGGDPPTKLYRRDIVKGKGKAAKSGDSVTVQYLGTSFSNGQQFDASWDTGKPFPPFKLGAGRVIPGWDGGVPGMRVGGRRLLVIPAALAYGATGQGSIGPNETLLFVIDMKKVA